MVPRHLERLLEALQIVLVVEAGDAIHQALGGCEQAQKSERRRSFGELRDRRIAHLHRAWWELDQERRKPVAAGLSEFELFHRAWK
jgi:hypothetical protein